MPAGRPSLYSDELAQSICEGIALGKSLVTVLKAKGMPSYTAVIDWLKKHPEFAVLYAQAREDQADFDADQIGQIADETRRGKVDPAAARVAIDAYKWTAGRRKPRVYGDKTLIGGVEDAPPVKLQHTLDVSNLNLEELAVLEAALMKVKS